MNNKRIARELMKLAKELQSSTDVVMISDLDNETAYFAEGVSDTKSNVDKSAYKEAVKLNDVITMGKTIATPEKYFSSKDKRNYSRYGNGRMFDI